MTATLGSVQIIEQLTEQNLDYEIKINELRDSISDLEAINEVNDQLVESAHEEENELRQNLDMAEMRIREVNEFCFPKMIKLAFIITWNLAYSLKRK